MIRQVVMAIAAMLAVTLTGDIALPTLRPAANHRLAEAPLPTPFQLNQFLVDQPNITVPFHLVDGFIMLDGQVDQTRGKFVFDTGTPDAFFLNRGFLPLTQDRFLAQGSAASGQPVAVYAQTQPVTIDLANQFQFANQSIRHGDFSFTQANLGDRFLGFVGHEFNRNYLFVINYEQQIIDFYSLKQDRKRLNATFDTRQLVTTIRFKSRPGEDRIPEFPITIGNEPLLGFLDTGNLGTLELTTALKAKLEQQGHLHCRPTDYWYGIRESRVQCTVRNLRYGNQTLANVHNLTLTISQKNEIGLGYQFLKHYVTAWNYRDRTITLLNP